MGQSLLVNFSLQMNVLWVLHASTGLSPTSSIVIKNNVIVGQSYGIITIKAGQK